MAGFKPVKYVHSTQHKSDCSTPKPIVNGETAQNWRCVERNGRYPTVSLSTTPFGLSAYKCGNEVGEDTCACVSVGERFGVRCSSCMWSRVVVNDLHK
ncbi:hypothetical protein AVEN_195599-1 [Araneus ventricosus]|uniref:Uncharacterized protein n=1 Tax=Araneus ventricosus TaxID=182803 RepID=A0A4Y2B8R1_ARAVE|nr:hypothetical protein AVEN_195599-1 [Araneus ventricosus]